MKKTVATALAGLTLAIAPAIVAAQTKWDLPAAYPSSNYHTQLLQAFARDVAELSKGKLSITVHDSASLYKAPEIKRAVQGNQAQIGEILLSNFANEDPVYELDGVPFLARGFDASWKLYQAQKPVLQKKLNAQGMTLLYSVPWPPQGLYTNRDLKSVADMKGLKWRAYSPATARLAELFNAQPVTVQASELSQAFATGIVDSFMSSGSTGYDSKVYEYVKHFYNTEAGLPKDAVIVNQRAFNALDAATQQAVLQAAAKAEEAGWKIAQERAAWYLEQLAKNGMTINTPTPELVAGLNKIGEIMLGEWLKKSGAEGQALIDNYRKQP